MTDTRGINYVGEVVLFSMTGEPPYVPIVKYAWAMEFVPHILVSDAANDGENHEGMA